MVPNRKATLLTVTTLLLAGCANRDYGVHGPDHPQWTKRPGPMVVDAKEQHPTKILPETHFAAGRLFESQGLFPKALDQYRKAVAVNHAYVAGYHRLGLLASMMGLREEALASLTRAVELSPDDAALRNNFGFELLLQQRWSEAESQFRRAVALKPSFARANINLGLVHGKQGRFDEALADFRAVLPESDAYYNLGLLYRSHQRHSDAADAFRQALWINPSFTAANTQLVQLGVDRFQPVVQETETLLASYAKLANRACDVPEREWDSTVDGVSDEAWEETSAWLEEITPRAASPDDEQLGTEPSDLFAPSDRYVDPAGHAPQTAEGEWAEPNESWDSTLDPFTDVPFLQPNDGWLDEQGLYEVFENERNCQELQDESWSALRGNRVAGVDRSEALNDPFVDFMERADETIDSYSADAASPTGPIVESFINDFWAEQFTGDFVTFGDEMSHPFALFSPQGAFDAEEPFDIDQLAGIASPADWVIGYDHSFDTWDQRESNATIDSWAMLRELEQELAEVRGEIECLESAGQSHRGKQRSSRRNLSAPLFVAAPSAILAPEAIRETTSADSFGPPAYLAPPSPVGSQHVGRRARLVSDPIHGERSETRNRDRDNDNTRESSAPDRTHPNRNEGNQNERDDHRQDSKSKDKDRTPTARVWDDARAEPARLDPFRGWLGIVVHEIEFWHAGDQRDDRSTPLFRDDEFIRPEYEGTPPEDDPALRLRGAHGRHIGPVRD